MNNPQKYFARALDPIHIGAGGYRLGRVDNTIVRDPATDLPKIPGTSLAGVIREFATLHLMENQGENKKDETEKRKSAEEKAKKYFGDESRQGMLRFYDGEILFFPVSSTQGTIFITTKKILKYWLVDEKSGENIKLPAKIEDKAYKIKGLDSFSKPLNLGWLSVELGKSEEEDQGETIMLPPYFDDLDIILLVSDKLFIHLVNDNLEVRTSVRIDPATGTTAEGALFTYEAIPRGTVFGFEIAADGRRGSKDEDITSLIHPTFSYLKLLGIGGLGTRGFGRVEVLNGINPEQEKEA